MPSLNPWLTPKWERLRAWSPRWVAGGVGALLVALSALWVVQTEQQHRAMLEAQARQAGDARSNALRRALDHSLGMLDVLDALVQQGHGHVPEFVPAAQRLLSVRPDVLGVGLLPGGRVAQVVPEALAQQVLGMDVLQGEHANPDAQRAWREGDRVVSAPSQLPMGGMGWLVHQPVTLPPHARVVGEPPEPWGLVRAAISLPSVLASAQLTELAESGWAYALRPQGNGWVAAESPSWGHATCTAQAVVVPFPLEGQVWELALCPSSGWRDTTGMTLRLGWALVFSGVGALLVYLLLLRMQFTGDLLRNLTRHVPGALYQYRLGPDGRTSFPYVSPGMRALTGIDPAVLRQTDAPWRALLQQPGKQVLADALRQSALHLAPLDVDLQLRLPDGEERWCWTQAQPQRQADGAVVWNGYLADWTTEKGTEDALANSNRLLNEAQAVARLGYFVTDLVNDCWTGSPVLDDIVGLDTNTKRTARSWMDLVEPEFRAGLRQVFRETVAKRTTFSTEYRVRRPCDDRVVWVQAMGRLELDASGAPVRILGTVQDITARKKAEADIRHLAHFDSLTGLPNRRLFQDRLEQALAHSQRHGTSGAVLFIDLDNFKDLNDAMGHQIGDALLCLVALRLLACVEESQTVARLGGDEFVLLIPELDPSCATAREAAQALGERVVAALLRPYALGGGQHTSTPSMGIALFKGDEQTADDIVKRADLAMYEAKAAGRNALRFFDPSMQQAVTERLQLVDDLRHAITANQLRLQYQPQHDDQGRLVGAEALLRWTHPHRGPVSPGVFVPLAEQAGLMEAMGQWVTQTACEQLSHWLADPALTGIRPGCFTLAVNVSAHQFRSADCVQDLTRGLQRWRIPAGMLKLELTESMMVHDVDDIVAKMNAMRDLGVLFSMDDFGTGYSSLSQLKRLPLDQLKIDQSFVRDVLNDPNDAAIARTVVALGQALDLEVIAEGVETQAQRDHLHAMGCRLYQGYWYSRPLDFEVFRAYALDFIQ